jgi:hypothetical protein
MMMMALAAKTAGARTPMPMMLLKPSVPMLAASSGRWVSAPAKVPRRAALLPGPMGGQAARLMVSARERLPVVSNCFRFPSPHQAPEAN